MKYVFSSITIVCVLAGPAWADIIGFSGGHAAPPETLGGYDMIPFPADPRPPMTVVTSVPSPFDEPLVFSVPLYKVLGGPWPGWPATQDHYSTYFGGVTLYLPAGTRAFGFYATVLGDGHIVTATADETTTVAQLVSYQFAKYFGFYVDSPEETITAITVEPNYGGLVMEVGSFYMAIPEPASGVILLLLVPAALGRRRC